MKINQARRPNIPAKKVADALAEHFSNLWHLEKKEVHFEGYQILKPLMKLLPK